MLTMCLSILLTSAPADFHARLEALQRAVREQSELDEDQRALLEARIAAVDVSLAKYEATIALEAERRKITDGFMIASAATTANDVTGVGVADNVLLPVLGFGAILSYLGTKAVASGAEHEAAEKLEDALSAAIMAGHTVLMAQQAGKKARALTGQIAQHLAELLGRSVGGRPPEHQKNPEPTRRHWWAEIKNFLRQIEDLGLSAKQILRNLSKELTTEQIAEIREALREAAKLMKENPPNFPPLAP